ncbi:MAG: 16S rRNA (cytidine(1402)-2'-O)-methyltransferase [Deltaproteobacteria bacterium]|nr:16S rRNA (cytidine(1402)-2'-O)-methyltransferase [Deltaproteobacteria bacterium]MBW2052717.1 16S rRNA (cytidine(1402)-2'-O)-methyltransferase [Deltaproteobacteria bacterium]MBW2141211.1 16S rRNA (cytidine(1402)-2'-O)-methyltransferase [Deltaproteobacteria bacterium]MBW2323073.1 16S rRNA (cytidine(1402)-2'-O)-methyltransferase [Deltaproteobacteria bacterium]
MVATPLGNLEDLTFRACRVLKEAGLVAAEDTRRTRKLFERYQITSRLISYREQNHSRVLPRLLKTLSEGRDLALVSDAGTPGVSDPGALLVKEAVEQGARVVPIPGPSAGACALSVSGMPGSDFVFVGFLPAKKEARLKAFQELRHERRTMIFYEAPHRVKKSLQDAAAVLGPRKAVLGREMTKLHEEFLRGSLPDIAAEIEHRSEAVRGELTLVVAGASGIKFKGLTREELEEIIRGDNRPVREIVADLAGIASTSRSELYRLALDVTKRRAKN